MGVRGRAPRALMSRPDAWDRIGIRSASGHTPPDTTRFGIPSEPTVYRVSEIRSSNPGLDNSTRNA